MVDFLRGLEITAHICIVLTFGYNIGKSLIWMYIQRRFFGGAQNSNTGSNLDGDMDIDALLQQGATALQGIMNPKPQMKRVPRKHPHPTTSNTRK